jgi:hypothetical protein
MMNSQPTDRLSRAASVIWRRRTAGPDPMGDPSGDCGPMIAAWTREGDLRAVADAGYATPGEYNAGLRRRMIGADGPMTLRVSELLAILEIEDVCPVCGAALDVTSHRTRQYGGGWDTFTRCPSCGHADAYV